MTYQLQKSDEEIKEIVKDNYGKIAEKYLSTPEIIEHTIDHSSCCETTTAADECCRPATTEVRECCAPSNAVELNILTTENFIPSFGCDTQLISIAAPRSGEVVLDLGSGPGKDILAAAQLVGKNGKVYGVDMTDQMLQLARDNAAKLEILNAEFLKGEITNLPIESDMIDLIISNCVVNLVPDKTSVFKESFRVLKAGGRFVISDMITLTDLQARDQLTEDLYCACIGGATSEIEYVNQMREAGFSNVSHIRRSEQSHGSGDSEIRYASTIFVGYK